MRTGTGIAETGPPLRTSRGPRKRLVPRHHGRLPLPEREGEDEGEVTPAGHRAPLCTPPFACLALLTRPPAAGDERQGLAPGPAPGLSFRSRAGFPGHREGSVCDHQGHDGLRASSLTSPMTTSHQ